MGYLKHKLIDQMIEECGCERNEMTTIPMTGRMAQCPQCFRLGQLPSEDQVQAENIMLSCPCCQNLWPMLRASLNDSQPIDVTRLPS